MGILEVISSSHQQGCKVEESPNGTSKHTEESGVSCQTGEALSNLGSPVENVDCQMKVDSMHDDCSWRKSEDAIETVDTKQPVVDDLICSNKRQKLDVPRVQQSVAVELTENSVIDWLKNFEDGVLLSDILEHFNGSKEESVVDLLNHMEGEFLIFKKNNLYKLM
ncbi:hypothetical protein DH2020_000774 [Rehmannia glutinosa]|uniref:Uncharacterized protein n=1 Tax=Rehmannia glutinosa TaxID=99300 RepID=A0ABR0XY45_REHGL